MFTKIMNVFSVFAFSSVSVKDTLPPILYYDSSTYPYGNHSLMHRDFSVLESEFFDKPAYFLWDLNTFLKFWDLYFVFSDEVNKIGFQTFYFDDCKRSSNDKNNVSEVSHPSKLLSLVLNLDILNYITSDYNVIGYMFGDKLLTLHGNLSRIVSFNKLLDYCSNNDCSKFFDKVYGDIKNNLDPVVTKHISNFDVIRYLNIFLASFIDYDCMTSSSFVIDQGDSNVFLVPHWSNLSTVNIRYFYLSVWTFLKDRFLSLDLSLLNVDFRNRKIIDRVVLNPVVSGSKYINVKFGDFTLNPDPYYYDGYLNLFSSGVSTSFAFNAMIIKLPIVVNVYRPEFILRFMNFSMLDATSMSGWNYDVNKAGYVFDILDMVTGQSCSWYNVFCHITSSIDWVFKNVIGFSHVYDVVNLFFTPITVSYNSYSRYMPLLGDMSFVSPVIVSGSMLLVLFSFYRRFK